MSVLGSKSLVSVLQTVTKYIIQSHSFDTFGVNVLIDHWNNYSDE